MASRLQDVIQRDTRANQPAATAVAIGTLYYVTDESVTERSNGTIWQSYSISAVSGINQLTSDVTAGPGTGSQAATIASKAVTNAKLADVATATFKGRTTAATGVPEDLTVTQATALLNAFVGDSGAGGTKGLVPAPATGDAAAGKYLKADGTFAVPSTGGSAEVLKARIVLTDAQIKSLSSVPIEIIASPGVGKYINIIGCTTLRDTTAGAYSYATTCYIRYAGTSDYLVANIALALSTSDKRWARWAMAALDYVTDPTNKVVEILSGNALTGGNAANYCVIEVVYTIVTDGP